MASGFKGFSFSLIPVDYGILAWLGKQMGARPSALYRRTLSTDIPCVANDSIQKCSYSLWGKFQHVGLSQMRLIWCRPKSAAVCPCALLLHSIPHLAGSTVPIVDLPSCATKVVLLVIHYMLFAWSGMQCITETHWNIGHLSKKCLGEEAGQFIPYGNKHNKRKCPRPCIHVWTVFTPGMGASFSALVNGGYFPRFSLFPCPNSSKFHSKADRTPGGRSESGTWRSNLLKLNAWYSPWMNWTGSCKESGWFPEMLNMGALGPKPWLSPFKPGSCYHWDGPLFQDTAVSCVRV